MSDWQIPMGSTRLIIRNCTRDQAFDRAMNWAGFLGYHGPIEVTPAPPARSTGEGLDSQTTDPIG